MRVEASGRMQRIAGTLSTSSLMSRPVCGGRQMCRRRLPLMGWWMRFRKESECSRLRAGG